MYETLNKDKVKIIEKFNNGESSSSIAKDYSCCYSTIIKKLKIWIDYEPYRRIGICEKNRNKIIELFQKGISCNKIAKSIDYDDYQVILSLRKWGFCTKRIRTLDDTNRKYHVNHYFLKRLIQKKGHGYLVGLWLMAI